MYATVLLYRVAKILRVLAIADTTPCLPPITTWFLRTNRYKCIVKYKTAFYSFYLPVAMGMMMAGISGKEKYDNALEILLEMGEFFQVRLFEN